MTKFGMELKKIGELLKEKRRSKGLEYSQVSEITKIRSEYLRGLENNDYSLFPSEAQAKGFLKKYSKFLGVNEEKALAMYRRERETTYDEKVIKDPVKINRTPSFTLTPGKLITAIVAGTVLAILFYIGSQINTIVKPPKLTVTTPVTLEAGQEGSLKVTSDNLTIEGDLDVGATLTVNGTKVTTNNLQKYQIPPFKLENGENKFILIAESQFGRKSQITLNIIKQTNISSISQMDVVITPTEKVPLIIISDNEQILNSTLNINEKIEFTSKESFTVRSSKLTKLEIRINGEIQTITSETAITWEIEDEKIIRN